MATIIDSSSTPSSGQTWQDKVAVKQRESQKNIPQAWRLPAEILDGYEKPFMQHQHRFMEADIPRRSGLLSDRELEITEKYDVKGLLERLASGTFSALEVTVAFSKRAAIAQQLTSCLTEMFFEDAQKRAKQLDELRAQGKLAGPLHGLPVSLKDTFKLVGMDATIGYAAWVGDKATTNSALVEMLLKLGAVLYVKTNVPQTMMTADTENNLFGRTLNPWNTSLTAGGSSGGEGALVAFRGSPLGIGTDVAGSVRIPALCCGTYGWKPTVGRIPFGGQAFSVKPGMRFIYACAGPLANDVDALELFAKTIIDAEPARYDAEAFDLPWRTVTKVSGKSTLRLGLLPDDPTFPLHPPVRRALDEAIAAIKAAGHEIVPIDIEKCRMIEAMEVALNIFGIDATGRSYIEQSGEPMIRSILQIRDAYQALKLKYTEGMVNMERLDRIAALTVMRQSVAESWREIWNSYDIDAVLCPAAQNTAVSHDAFGLPLYTGLLNLLDYPGCVIPFQKVRPELDSEPLVMKPGERGPNYDPKLLAGVPCSIQIFTNKMRDEECIAVTKIVDQCLKKL